MAALQPLAAPEMPLDAPPLRTSRFGSPLVLDRVHWVRPELVVQVKYRGELLHPNADAASARRSRG